MPRTPSDLTCPDNSLGQPCSRENVRLLLAFGGSPGLDGKLVPWTDEERSSLASIVSAPLTNQEYDDMDIIHLNSPYTRSIVYLVLILSFESDLRQYEIADMFGLSLGQVGSIANGQSCQGTWARYWRDRGLPAPYPDYEYRSSNPSPKMSVPHGIGYC